MRKVQLLRRFATKSTKPEPTQSNTSTVLTRDFIHDRLYYPKTGYFSKNDAQLGYLEEPINFSKIFGYEDYTRILEERYPKNAWLTPSEIFKPWYGMTIANYISVCIDKYAESNPMSKHQRVKIIEVGAGNGSAAESMLDFFRSFHPLKYKHMEFTIVEISPIMTQRCRKNLSRKHGKKIKNNQIRFENSSISKYNKKDTDLVFVVMLEVLDNMPHDRIYFDGEEPEESWVEFSEDDQFMEERRQSLTDPTVKKVWDIYEKIKDTEHSHELNTKKSSLMSRIYESFTKPSKPTSIFLPTYYQLVLDNLKKNIPNAHLILADFDLLQSAQSSKIGLWAPTVSKKLEGSDEKHDFEDHLVPRGEADIFFPTDFRLISEMTTNTFGGRGRFLKSYQFFEEYGGNTWGKTVSGYNPLKEDFWNTSFFVSSVGDGFGEDA